MNWWITKGSSQSVPEKKIIWFDSKSCLEAVGRFIVIAREVEEDAETSLNIGIDFTS